MAVIRAPRRSPIRTGRWPRAVAPVLVAAALSGCSLLATPSAAPVHDSSLAPPGPVGYVVCPTAVTPVELTTGTAEAPIPLPISGTPVLGNFAIATSPDGRWAYVVTTSGVGRSSASAASRHNVVVPIDLATQQALAPIAIPGQGGTHAVVVMPNGRTVLAASGSTIVPVDASTREVGIPLDLGAGDTIFGLALDPLNAMLYALVPGAVVPVNTADATARTAIPTGLSISSVSSPHGIAVTGDGSTIYVVGQGGTDFGGRVLPIMAGTGVTLPTTGFDRFGISDPAALALAPDGSALLVVDSANNWVEPVDLSAFASPSQPVRLPQRTGGVTDSGTGHPTDIVAGPLRTGAFVVDGHNSVVPYAPASRAFGRAIPVCSGASSMTVVAAP